MSVVMEVRTPIRVLRYIGFWEVQLMMTDRFSWWWEWWECDYVISDKVQAAGNSVQGFQGPWWVRKYERAWWGVLHCTYQVHNNGGRPEGTDERFRSHALYSLLSKPLPASHVFKILYKEVRVTFAKQREISFCQDQVERYSFGVERERERERQ